MSWWLGKKGKEKPLEGQVKMDELITNDIWEHDEPRIEPAE